MSERFVSTRIIQKHDTELNWESSNIVPHNGELIVYDPDENYSYWRIKIGNGIDAAKNLPFIVDVSDLERQIKAMTPLPDIETTDDVILKLNELINQISEMEFSISSMNNKILSLTPSIGEIYITLSEQHPAEKFGGVWEQIKDTFLLAAGNIYEAGSIGGEVEHTLTELEMPAHDHEFDRHQLWRNETIPPSTHAQSDGYGANNKTLPIYTDTTIATGAGEPHNNMPPYLTVYIWKRIS